MTTYYSKSTKGFYPTDIFSGSERPSDCVEITKAYQIELLAAESEGKVIVADKNGYPYAKDRPATTTEKLSLIARSKRDALIAATDYLVMPDYPISADLLAAIKVYRQALRDVTDQDGFPTEIAWPVNPFKSPQ